MSLPPDESYWDEDRDGPNDARLASQGVNIEPTDNINHDSYKGMP